MGLEQYRVNVESKHTNDFVFASILDGIDSSWSTIEKAKYIHDAICRVSTYDERFIFSSNPDLLSAIYNKEINVDVPMTPVFICKSFNEIYSELLNRIGIRNRIISKKSTLNPNIQVEDTALVFLDESGDTYLTNIAADIQRSKYGMMTRFFGGRDTDNIYGVSDEITVLTQEQLKNIDIKTGYLSKSGIYSDKVFELITNEIHQDSQIIQTLLNIPSIIRDYLLTLGINDAQNISEEELKQYVTAFTTDDIMRIKVMLLKYFKLTDPTTGTIENKKHYKELCRSVFTRKERRNYACFDMIKEQEDSFEVLSIIKMKLKNEGVVYYAYSEGTHQYEPISIEDIHLIARDYKSYQDLDLLDEEIPR